MNEMPISKFKATCLGVVEEVRKTRIPVRITRFGKPVAEIVPITAPPRNSWIGALRDTVELADDIVGPVGAFENWQVREPEKRKR